MILNMLIKTCLIALILNDDSLYYASYEEDIKKLEKELYYLHKHDFKSDLAIRGTNWTEISI